MSSSCLEQQASEIAEASALHRPVMSTASMRTNSSSSQNRCMMSMMIDETWRR